MNTEATPAVLGLSEGLGPLVEAAGMVNVLNHGSGSCVYSEGCHGVTQEHLERFAELVRADERKVRNQLGELPDPSFTYERRPAGCEPERVGAYTADQLRAYAAQEVAKAQGEHRALRMALRGMVDAAERVDLDRPTFGDCQAMRKARAALALVDG